MSTSDHPETDGQTERVNRVLEEILRGYVQYFIDWSEFLPILKFAIISSVHASTTYTPFIVNSLRHPRLPTHLECDTNSRGEGYARAKNVLALAHHVSRLLTTRTLPMSIKLTSKLMISAIVATLLLTQMRMAMLVYLASPMTTPARMRTHSLKMRIIS